MSPLVLAIVVPCYDEAEVLPATHRRIDELLKQLIDAGEISARSRVWYIDDGSRDRTWATIREAGEAPGSRVCGIKLSRNCGHQAALMAGLMTATGDVLVSIDADLQDDLGAIPRMLKEYRAGCDIVYGVRGSRDSDAFLKRVTAEGYYAFLRKLGVEVVFNHADYRLMSRRAIEALRAFPESNVYLRGLVQRLGFRTAQVEYPRAKRLAGESKYTVRRLVGMAWDGLTSFSTVPLRAITVLGLLVSAGSVGLGFWALWVRVFSDHKIPGWASTVVPLFFLSGMQLLSLGVMGEYLAKIFMETKRRPMYIIEQVTRGLDDETIDR